MSKDMSVYVLAKIEDVIKRQFRKSISPRERLAVALRYLATGESFTSLSYNYRIGATTIGLIVKDVCAAIWQTMQPEFMKVPSTSDDWREVANGFEESWQFPNCCGAVDGKHVVMKAPPNSGSVFYNYKGAFSIIILAAVDAYYRFITIDVGSYGMNNDAGVFRSSKFGQALKNESLSLPQDRALPGAEDFGELPYVFFADEGLPLLKNLMRPYGGRGRTEEERIFNYRLSRARRIVESAFGILAARWIVFHTKIMTEPSTVAYVAVPAPPFLLSFNSLLCACTCPLNFSNEF